MADSEFNGRSLQELLKKQGTLPPDQALQIMDKLLENLESIHRSGTLVLDIRPCNIFLSENGDVRITDFNASVSIEDAKKRRALVMHPRYAPPELYGIRADLGTWTDVYEAAATFYHMITGKVPPESLDRMSDDSLEPPSRSGIPLSRKAEKALMAGLSLSAKTRIQTAEEFRRQLAGR